MCLLAQKIIVTGPVGALRKNVTQEKVRKRTTVGVSFTSVANRFDSPYDTSNSGCGKVIFFCRNASGLVKIKAMTLELTFLGTGTSQGVPLIACDCPVCTSDDPRDSRLRTSVLLTVDNRNILIDATPELRLQCLWNDVRRLDAILVTHTHADHILGLDDVRRFCQLQHEPINLYAAPDHIKSIEKIFGYARADRACGNRDLPQLIFNTILPDQDSFSLFGRPIIPLPLWHGPDSILGYRVGGLAYCTDVTRMPDETLRKLEGLDVLVLGALRPQPHPKHLSFDQAIELAQRVGAGRTYFVHMTHQISHREQEKLLPPTIHLAYDSLKIATD